ncbi:6296_t:CDS:2 [Funneliformis caledonium]|uniref:6296_t:CDS:1 n=1 Tax=Funneliformis caledonium TaxID=1117310 RepID=A0A9N9GAW1_9GLOM|nr:6296_t:CDS:2 [Funneliformis caledonium]
MYFIKELSEAIKILANDEFEELFNNLKSGINKAYEYFENVICGLGGDSAHLFANSWRECWKKQQVEELYNKLDLKTHANMSLSLKQSKLRLASSKVGKENLTAGLEEFRAQRQFRFKTSNHH